MKHVLFQILLILVCYSFPVIVEGQNESSNWYFGNNAGVTFNSGSPVALTNGALSTHEGVATISDNSGSLLFYTDGIKVYNAAHLIMSNGSGLMGNGSSTQSAIIVRKPFSSFLYYIFTMDDITGNSGLRYSIVDMTLNGGLGDITQKNILVYASTRERLTSIKHANGTDFWILINSYNNDDIRAYHLDSAGLDTTGVISNVGPIHGGSSANTRGYMKASRQHNRLAIATWSIKSFVVLNFDNATGIADSASRIDIKGSQTGMDYAYGVEFSPSGNILYGTTLRSPFKVLQFDLSSGIDSVIYQTLDTLAINTSGAGCSFFYGALQLAPDGKIYGVDECDSFLNVINYPDSLGTACGYVAQGFALAGNDCDLGLPNFISDYILPLTIAEQNATNKIGFSLHPNPASDHLELTINGTSIFEKTTYSIVDILGNVIIKSNVANSVSIIQVGNLANGLYFLQVSNESSFVAKKFLVVR